LQCKSLGVIFPAACCGVVHLLLLFSFVARLLKNLFDKLDATVSLKTIRAINKIKIIEYLDLKENFMNVKKLLILVSMSVFASAAFADDAAVFKKKCGTCHALSSVSKGSQGPDLTGFASKRPADYLKAYMKNPSEAKKTYADIYNKDVKGKYKFAMPAVKLTEAEEASILNLLK
jgi:cytochrome c553